MILYYNSKYSLFAKHVQFKQAEKLMESDKILTNLFPDIIRNRILLNNICDVADNKFRAVCDGLQ